MTLLHAAADVLDDVGRMLRKNGLGGKEVIHIPVDLGVEAGLVGLVEHLENRAHDADVGAEAGFVVRVAAPRMIEVRVHAQHDLNLVRRSFVVGFARAGHGKKTNEDRDSQHEGGTVCHLVATLASRAGHPSVPLTI